MEKYVSNWCKKGVRGREESAEKKELLCTLEYLLSVCNVMHEEATGHRYVITSDAANVQACQTVSVFPSVRHCENVCVCVCVCVGV